MRLTRRHLHARSVKGCATIMAPDALALSPVTGALCWGSPALSALWHVGGDGGDSCPTEAERYAGEEGDLCPTYPCNNAGVRNEGGTLPQTRASPFAQVSNAEGQSDLFLPRLDVVTTPYLTAPSDTTQSVDAPLSEPAAIMISAQLGEVLLIDQREIAP